VGFDRPITISKFCYRENKEKYDRKIQPYIDLILSVLKNWYPEEYSLLVTLYSDGSKKFKQKMVGYDLLVDHLLGYGMVKKIKEDYYITLEALKNYIGLKIKSIRRYKHSRRKKERDFN